MPSIEPLSILILVNALSLASIAEINLVADKSVNEPAVGVVPPITEPSTEPPEIAILLIVDVPLTIRLLTVVSPLTLSVPLNPAFTALRSADNVASPVIPSVPPTVAFEVIVAMEPVTVPLAVISVPEIVDVELIVPTPNVPPSVVLPATFKVPPKVVLPVIPAVPVVNNEPFILISPPDVTVVPDPEYPSPIVTSPDNVDIPVISNLPEDFNTALAPPPIVIILSVTSLNIDIFLLLVELIFPPRITLPESSVLPATSSVPPMFVFPDVSEIVKLSIDRPLLKLTKPDAVNVPPIVVLESICAVPCTDKLSVILVNPTISTVPPIFVSPDVSATEKLSIESPPDIVVKPVTPRVPPIVWLSVTLNESKSVAPATLRVPLITAFDTTDNPVPLALLNVKVSDISAVLFISTAPAKVEPLVTERVFKDANPTVPTVVNRPVDAVVEPIAVFSTVPPDIAIALIVDVPVTTILVNVEVPLTLNVPPIVAVSLRATLFAVTALLLTNELNVPAAAELAPITVPSIAPPPISTIGKVAVPTTFKLESA